MIDSFGLKNQGTRTVVDFLSQVAAWASSDVSSVDGTAKSSTESLICMRLRTIYPRAGDMHSRGDKAFYELHG